MSPEVIAVGIFGIAGVVAGVLIERIVRAVGRVTCFPSGWETRFLSLDDYGNPEGPEPQRPEEAAAAEYRFAIDLFNGRETPTGLRDCRIELVLDGAPPIRSHPEDLGGVSGPIFTAGNVPYFTPPDKLETINLPPRQYVHIDLKGRFGRKGAVALFSEEWIRIEFVGEFPGRPIFGVLGNKTYRETVISSTHVPTA